MRWGVSLVLMMGLFLPSVVWAADGTVEAAQPTTHVETASREQILQAIETTGQTDPELAREMAQQLQLLESGQLDPRTLEITDKELTHGISPQPGELPGGTPLPMPVVDGGGSLVGPEGGAGDSLPPEARKELEELFRQGTGDPNSEKDRELREKAGEILEKYGVEPREMEAGHEGREGKGEYGRESSHEFGAGLERGEGFERALEQMAPEAREQMERFMSERESMERGGMDHGGMERDAMEREFGGPSPEREVDSHTREHEATTREYEAPTRDYEAPTREYEAPTREYEAPAREHEAPAREYEAPARESETPTREYDAPTHEYEAPRPEYESPGPGPGDGSGMGSY